MGNLVTWTQDSVGNTRSVRGTRENGNVGRHQEFWSHFLPPPRGEVEVMELPVDTRSF